MINQSKSFTLPHPSAAYIPPKDSIGVWFTQAHSCQRDMILAAKTFSHANNIHVVASHKDLRPEITSVADIALQEPESGRIEWILSQVQRLNVKLIIAGSYTKLYLKHRKQFEELGVRLMAGSTAPEFIEQLNDKSEFTKICQQNQIDVVPATTVKNAQDMQSAFNYWSAKGEVCVKPVHGVFASGFWHLDPNAQPFDAFANSKNYKANPKIFIEAYAQLPNPPAYLVMPFLSEVECSVDMYCRDGLIVQAVARYKQNGDYQTLALTDPAIAMAGKVVNLFKCDGLVNMQARYNKEGKLFILEINPRPSGGIANTFHSGVNLVHAAISDALEVDYRPVGVVAPVVVRSVSHPIVI